MKIGDIISWNPETFRNPVFTPYTTRQMAAWNLRKKRTEIVFDTMKNLEGYPITPEITAQILEGSDPCVEPKISLNTQAFAEAFDDLCENILHDNFVFSKADACYTHNLAAKHQLAVHCTGSFRNDQVCLNGIKWLPPKHQLLNKLWEEGEKELSKIENPAERGVITFLWMARSQFFFDCNKRTASLMANGILAKAGCPPLTFNSEDQRRFMFSLAMFYQSGDPEFIIDVFAEYMQNWRDQVRRLD